MEMVTHKGSCHCGAIQFEVKAPPVIHAYECDCSICEMSGFIHLIVPKSGFSLLKGKTNLTTYTFNSKVAQHTFCKTCGIKSFYIPRSNPDGYSINVKCLDSSTIRQVEVEPFDGLNWERNAKKLAYLTKE